MTNKTITRAAMIMHEKRPRSCSKRRITPSNRTKKKTSTPSERSKVPADDPLNHPLATTEVINNPTKPFDTENSKLRGGDEASN
ncbi:hypothetical protein JTE90_026608 [Oedothorax gibbosus]|uniref:Uncharacterized protein n=1 Tax=Oedothorax gibbosus TaxID=931172 RepID=A0AAV6V1A4_9ARAC|nr:hypothetical protein JTE90_026608 [Oedothorax gibbosus]